MDLSPDSCYQRFVGIVGFTTNLKTRDGNKLMKTKFLAVLALIFAGNAATAGNLVAPIMEEDVIQEETAASSGGFLVPLILLALLAAAVGSGGGGSTPPPEG